MSNISKEDPNKVQELHIQSTKKPTGAGMSRAAKRRNKKKRQQQTEKSTSETTTDHVDHFLTSKKNPPSLLVSEYTKLEKKRSNNFPAKYLEGVANQRIAELTGLLVLIVGIRILWV